MGSDPDHVKIFSASICFFALFDITRCSRRKNQNLYTGNSFRRFDCPVAWTVCRIHRLIFPAWFHFVHYGTGVFPCS